MSPRIITLFCIKRALFIFFRLETCIIYTYHKILQTSSFHPRPSHGRPTLDEERPTRACEDPWTTGFTNLTGPVKPPPSGSGLPDRFDWKPVKFKSKFKSTCVTGSDRYTDRFDRFTGREDRFTGRYDWFGNFLFFLNSNLNFELGPVDRFDRFTGRYDRFGNFYFFEFKFEFWIGASLTVTGPDLFDR